MQQQKFHQQLVSLISDADADADAGDELSRSASLESLHRAIVYPANSSLLPHSAPFLSQSLSQLLSSPSSPISVTRAAALSYAALSAVILRNLSSTSSDSLHLNLVTIVDRFISWALPLLSSSPDLAVDVLHEFLAVSATAAAADRYVPSILRASQELLEDERTSPALLRRILNLLVVISVNFPLCFRPHFPDIVDLLLGWAFMPGLSDNDRATITDAFIHFQTHWLSNLQFPLDLLSKFLGDMEALLLHDQDASAPAANRLLALLSCFAAVTQAIHVDTNILERIVEPVQDMTPRLIRCISICGAKFGWSRWMGLSWRCLIVVAEILQNRFCDFYSMVIDDFLFKSLDGSGILLPAIQLQALLKSNLQLLSLQKLGLLKSDVGSLLRFAYPISQLRLHPNHIVVASSAATYLFFLQHDSDSVVSQCINNLLEELEILKSLLKKTRLEEDEDIKFAKVYSENELLSLMRFNLKLSLTSVSSGASPDRRIDHSLRYERSRRLTTFILEKLNPFDFPFLDYLEMQGHIIRTLSMLSEVEFSSNILLLGSYSNQVTGVVRSETQERRDFKKMRAVLIRNYVRRYAQWMVRALDVSSSTIVKVEALKWIHGFGLWIVEKNKVADLVEHFFGLEGLATISHELLVPILNAAYDREVKVRSLVASVLDALLQGGMVNHENFSIVSAVAIDKLGDPDASVKDSFARVLSVVLPSTVYTYGLTDDIFGSSTARQTKLNPKICFSWKQALALKVFSRKLNMQQLVMVLGYISQRWKAPLSSWIRRLVFNAPRNDLASSQQEGGDLGACGMWNDSEVGDAMFDQICSLNSVAAVWWSIHEAARLCITLRLRTNLGGPTQTFAALERMLLDIPNSLAIDTEQSDGTFNFHSSDAHLLPMRLLLDFIEALKKNVYNAYEGSFVLPSPMRQSSLFFRTNRRVCEEWFSRMCEPMMNAGVALHDHNAVNHYCVLRLQDLRNLAASTFKEKGRGTADAENLHSVRAKLSADVSRVSKHAAMALCRNYEPEALSGLQKWSSRVFSSLFVGEGHMNPGATEAFAPFSWMDGLIFQSQGQYEKAAAYFSHLLESEEALSSMGSDGIQFVIERIIECFSSLSDWKSLEKWLAELQILRSVHAGKVYSGALTAAGNELNAVHALACFDEGNIHAARSYLDLTPKSSNLLTIDPKLALERSEQMLVRSMLQDAGQTEKAMQDLEKAKKMLDEALSVLPLDSLTESAAFVFQFRCILALEQGCEHKTVHSSLDSLYHILNLPISKVNQDCSLWIKFFRICHVMLPNSLVTELFCHRLHTLAWRQNNFMLADRMFQYLKDHPSASFEGKPRELLDLSLQYERILQKHAEGKQDDAVIDVWSLIRMDIISAESAISVDDSSVLKAKACLKLSSWLRQDDRTIDIRNFLSKMSQDFKEYCGKSSPFINMEVSFSEIDPLVDARWNIALEEVVGIATKLSCQLCPTMGRAWLSYASWCFSQAQGSVPANGAVLQSSFSPYLHPEISVDRFQLTQEETSRLEAAIRKICVSVMGNVQSGMGDEEKQLSREALVNKLVQKAKYLMEAAAGLLGVETSENHCPSAILAAQLQMLFLHENSSLSKCEMLSSINEVIDIWWSLRIRRISLFGHAARGYFNYLSNSSSQFQEVHLNGRFYSSKEKTRSNTLRAMLYILHILSNYGAELQEILESGFSAVVLSPWQEITPQLYARLSSHPKEVVRKQLEGLIMMLAKQSPWSIVFPTLVDMNTYEGAPSEELQHIYDCLAQIYPNLVQDVQLVINELGAITVLWEEQWLSTLQDLHTDVLRRINMLKEEAARLAVNSTLTHAEKNKISAAKYSAMMAPIIVALERRLAMTTRTPETDHELWFLKEYGDQLKSAILAFKSPPSNAAALGEVWRPFDTIATSLASCLRKSSISLSEVAPRLAKLCSSNVPMPGLEKQVSILDSHDGVAEREGIITISSLCNNLTMLPTKTRPKKLVVLGSDGQKYTYLLKGREDLRLDARIMQLLQAVDSFLKSCGDTQRRSLGIRYYSVTPISGRAGLIQWVDNVTSIYSIFKSWQTRNQHVQLSATGSTNMNISMPPVPRPSDMFYGKIIPALKDKGIRKVISRRDWPHEVKRKVLLELMKETPRQLLWQEMWCASEGFKEFNLKAKRFSGTVGAMSMLGHFLGLGDRHLDNILMDFSSGDVVHIDYNVCFEKGRRLKIPEIVPFRLTQIIESALGLTGIEGAFRANCEKVVSILRKNKDVILMLLEVFLWDPLVEWTRGDIHDDAAIGGEEKKGMELAVSLSLFASRVQEIRVKLQEHHDLLLSTIPAAESALKRFLNLLNHYEIASALSYHFDKEKSSLLQREASAKAVLAEASSISEETRSSFELHAREYEQAKAAVTEQAQEATMWIEQHRVVLDALRGGSTPDPSGFLKLSSLENDLSLLAAVSTCGVPLTVVPEPTQAQCYDLDREVAHVAAELDTGLSSACEALRDYALVMQRVLPLNYMTTSPVYGWMQILQVSMTNLSSDVFSLVRRQAAELILKVQKEGLEPIKKRHLDLFHKMEVYITEIDKVNGECSELMSSLESDTEAKSKEHLVSSFTKYLQFESYSRNTDAVLGIQSGENKHSRKAKFQMQADIEEKKATVLTVVCTAVNELYKQIRNKIHDISNHSFGNINWSIGVDSLKPNCIIFNDFEEQVEKSTLVAAFVNEIQELLGTSSENVKFASEGNWASLFQATLCCTKSLVDQITMIVLPDLIKLSVSNNSEVMEAFGCLSKVRSSIDTSLEQLVEVQLERMSLMELEKTYSMKVGLITEQQLALEEASAKGREHLSWEEAEELASQEEACRAQLDQLHQTWSQKDMKSSSLTKIEVNIKNTLVATEIYFSSLTSKERDGDVQLGRGKILLAALIKPFSELEVIDKKLSSYDALPSADASFNLSNIMTCSISISETIWRFTSLLKGLSFFMWKIGILDSILDSCVHDISSSIDQHLGYDQLYNILKKKLENHLHEQIDQYIKGRVAPVFMHQLEIESEKLQQVVEGKREIVSEQIKKDVGTIRRVQDMLEEYCNAHETARAARSAVSVMKKQALDFSEALGKTVLEIVQLEWLHDLPLSHPLKAKILSQNILGDDKLSSMVVNLSRQKLLDKIQSSVSTLARSIECLQSCEQTSVPVEGQLERAMGWACGGQTNTGATGSSVKNSGIPSEFHDHLLRRRQLLWAAREHGTSISNVCAAVLEFEASRDGIFRIPSDKSSGNSTVDGRLWQQAYLKALNRLDVAYHSFSCAEQEWKLAQNRLEAAAKSLFSVSNELSALSVNAKSASDDLHDTLKAMHECAIEAATALSAFGQTSRSHTALTSDCGSMLEEVLAITENLPDVYGLGKEAVIMHRTLMEDLSKINKILLPLETSLSADKRALAGAISKEKEGNSISTIHGQVLYQSYFFRIREASESLTALVPSVTDTIKELYSMLTKLARISSLHAGNLHKALEGLGESQVLRSQELALSGSELRDDADTFDSKNSGIFPGSNGDNFEVPATTPIYSFQDEGWISPPEHTYTGSPESSLTSIEACLSEKSDRTEHFSIGKSGEDNGTDSISFTSRDGQERTPEMTESQSAENRENFSHSYAVTGDPCETMHALPADLHDVNCSVSALQLNEEEHVELSSSTRAKTTGLNHSHDHEQKPLKVMDEQFQFKKSPGYDRVPDDPSQVESSIKRRGTNVYAMSVLKQVELKLEGREKQDIRPMKITEQVDYLLRQATSIDNLCNMYEGWTPWI